MKKKHLLLLLVVFINCSSGASREARSPDGDNQSGDVVNLPVRQDSAGTNKAGDLVQKLQVAGEAEQEKVKKELSLLAEESAESREQVIQELIIRVKGSDVRSRLTSRAHYNAWKSAVDLLGQLKATEAIDVLVECIACNDGIAGLSNDRYPALKAILAIGHEAIPKLTQALSNNDDPATRIFSASALGQLGGDEAKEALEQALLSEQNTEVAASIRVALKTTLKSSAGY